MEPFPASHAEHPGNDFDHFLAHDEQVYEPDRRGKYERGDSGRWQGEKPHEKQVVEHGEARVAACAAYADYHGNVERAERIGERKEDEHAVEVCECLG